MYHDITLADIGQQYGRYRRHATGEYQRVFRFTPLGEFGRTPWIFDLGASVTWTLPTPERSGGKPNHTSGESTRPAGADRRGP